MEADQKKIAFIICSNDELETAECMFYLNRLVQPPGYNVEVLTIVEAASMAEGYQEGQDSSNAKYKIYLHQDVFLINRMFLPDMLRVFQSDGQIGMFGCIGSRKLSEDAMAVSGWDTGHVYHNCVPPAMERYQNPDRTPCEVEAVDGLLIATQYDLPWREDIFEGWDFYDVSQCFEFHRAGWKVAVPYQEKPWCYHDNQYSKMGRYHAFRKKFIEEYQDIRTFKYRKETETSGEYETIKEMSRASIRELIEKGGKEEVIELFLEPQNRGFLHLREYEIMADIANLEMCNRSALCFWNPGDSCDGLIQKLRILKYGIKRIEYEAESAAEVMKRLEEAYSIYAVAAVIRGYAVELNRVASEILHYYQKEKAMNHYYIFQKLMEVVMKDQILTDI